MGETKFPENTVFGLDIGTRSVVGTVGYRRPSGEFVIMAQKSAFHETRAMLDGQIHDISKVADTVFKVKYELEKELNATLDSVCIAAAGRVLKTVTVRMDYDLGDEMAVTEEMVYAMELMGMEQAHAKLRAEEKDGTEYFCVGYSVVKYYLGAIQLTKLEGHRGTKISADVLATFLPRDVIDGLYAVCDKAKLKVLNLTLEPIAAINIAIPEKFRLLNLSLVDIGAGTSDICITKEGSIIGYGMLPCAGDYLTESIMYALLTDFNTAEAIKLAYSNKKKKITYKDVMGTKQTIESSKIQEILDEPFKKLAKLIANKILELNGGEKVGAVFIVGGGGKNPAFAKLLAEAIGLPEQRVALRGEEVFSRIITPDGKHVKDPMLVTPIGICMNYFEQNNNFISVKMNGTDIKLYDNGKLNVMDAIVSGGMSNNDIFPKRGADLKFYVNGKERVIRGKNGDSSVIIINGVEGSVTTPISNNDEITLTPSTAGERAGCKISSLKEYNDGLYFIINGKQTRFEKKVTVNGKSVDSGYSICEGDEVRVPDYYTLEELLLQLKISEGFTVTVNNKEISLEDYDRNEKVFGNYIIDIASAHKEKLKGIIKDARDVVEAESDGETVVDDREMMDGEDYETFLDRRYGKNQYRSVKKPEEKDNKGSGGFGSMSAEEINALLAADRMETQLRYKDLEKKSAELNKELEKLRQSNDKTKLSSSDQEKKADYGLGTGQNIGNTQNLGPFFSQNQSMGIPQDLGPFFSKNQGLSQAQTSASDWNKELNAGADVQAGKKDIIILVNNSQVRLTGKQNYTFVDILDFYPFNISSMQGTRLIQRCNGKTADFFTPISEGDVVDLYWEN